MNTQNKGDILAERIEEIKVRMHDAGSRLYAGYIEEAIREYREPLPSVAKPILTPEQIAAGWVEWRGGECPVWGGSKPEYKTRSGGSLWDATADQFRWKHTGAISDIVAYLPDPYEALKKAHAEGSVIQFNYGQTIADWCDMEKTPTWVDPVKRYRVKPEPVMVQLGPEDVTLRKIVQIATAGVENNQVTQCNHIAPTPEKWAAEKAAFAAGKTVQWRFSEDDMHWVDCGDKIEPNWFADCLYRVKPAPVLVELGPEDVPPGSVFRKDDWKMYAFRALVSLSEERVCLGAAYGDGFEEYSFSQLKYYGFKISRDFGKTWHPCSKPADAKEGK